MKKLICLLLALSLLCAGVALADTEINTDGGTGETTVTYTVPEAGTDYTVIIPPSVNFDAGTTATLSVSIAEGSTLAQKKELSVQLSDTKNFYRLLNGDNEIRYEIWKESLRLSEGSEVLSWRAARPFLRLRR